MPVHNGWVILPITEYQRRLFQEGIYVLIHDPLAAEHEDYVRYVIADRGFLIGAMPRQAPQVIDDLYAPDVPAIFINPTIDPEPLLTMLTKVPALDAPPHHHYNEVTALAVAIGEACSPTDPRRLVVEVGNALRRLEETL